MSEKSKGQKIHDIMRELQWLLPALVTFYGVLDEIFGWNLMDPISRIVTGFVALLGVIVQHRSRVYFSEHVVRPVEMTEEEIAALEDTYDDIVIRQEMEREAEDE